MADNETNSTEATATNSAKVKTVAEDMPSRRTFNSLAEAGQFLAAQSEALSDFGSTPLLFGGREYNDDGTAKVDSDGNPSLDAAKFADDSTMVMVSRLTQQPKGTDGKAIAGSSREPKAIVVFPFPTIEALLANEAGRAWMQGIMDKEFNHVAVRSLRAAEESEFDKFEREIPATLEEFITSSRGAGDSALETFNDYYSDVLDLFRANVPLVANTRLIKSELIKAMESAGYAAALYRHLESPDNGDTSYFSQMIDLMRMFAEEEGKDTALLDTWSSTRDSKTFNADGTADDEEAKPVSLADMKAQLVANKAKAAEEAAKSDDATTEEAGDTAEATDENTAE